MIRGKAFRSGPVAASESDSTDYPKHWLGSAHAAQAAATQAAPVGSGNILSAAGMRVGGDIISAGGVHTKQDAN